jgi:DNA replication protein DnaC
VAKGRTARKQNGITRLADFPAMKKFDDFNFEFAKDLIRDRSRNLAGLSSLDRSESVI